MSSRRASCFKISVAYPTFSMRIYFHWLEALSLLRKLLEAVHVLRDLKLQTVCDRFSNASRTMLTACYRQRSLAPIFKPLCTTPSGLSYPRWD
jgi:hypothetical protein